MDDAPVRGGDYFDRIRAVAVAALIAASGAAILGSFLDWVRIVRRPELVPGYDFGGTSGVEAPPLTEPFSGVEARDGWFVVGAAGLLILLALLLLVRKRSFYGWLAFFTSLAIGSVVVAAYRGIGDFSSSISHRMNIVGQADVAIGLMLVAAAVGVATIASLVAIAASPRREDE